MSQLSPKARKARALRRHKESSLAVADACAEAARRATGEESRRLATAARRIHDCASSFAVHIVTPPGGVSRLVIRHGWDCRFPYCQVSARKKAAAARRKTKAIITIAQELEPMAPLVFLTLTARNEPWDDLAEMLDRLAAAEERFFHLQPVKNAFIGAISAREIVCRGTRTNPEAGAHTHLLVACHPAYFERSADQPRYLSQQAITLLFQRCLRASYKPIVHIQRVRAADGSTGPESIAHSVRELNKYIVKPAELFTKSARGLEADPDVIRVLARALYRRRMLRMTGIFAKASRIHNKQKEAGTPETT